MTATPSLQSYRVPGKAHSLMGFHDTSAIDSASGRMVLLGVDGINRPPVAGDRAHVAIVDWRTGKGEVVSETDAWNFPQGGRQHFLSGDRITYNLSDGVDWIGVVQCLGSGRKLLLERALYAVARETGYGLNFARLHRLGGYGYVGLPDPTANSTAPNNDGIWSVDLSTGKARLLVSIAQAVDADATLPRDQPHYFTHIVPSPDGRKLCFLHRYWLPDGGIQTRLLVCGSDGSGLSCWASGYLSHFDWKDHDTIMIWGRPPSSLQRTRNHPLLRVPGIRQAIQLGKPLAKRLLGGKAGAGGAYMLVGEGGYMGQSFATEFLREDGHPSFRPGARDWLLTDTYPNSRGERPLLLLPTRSPQLHCLLVLTELRASAKQDRLDQAMAGIDAAVQHSFSPALFAHTRSGIHCDFHPRWRPDGGAVCFDSNHEGFRSVYSLDVSAIVGSLA